MKLLATFTYLLIEIQALAHHLKKNSTFRQQIVAAQLRKKQLYKI